MKSLLGPSAILATALLLGRVSGVAREATVSSIFGVSHEGDIAVIIMTIPDLLVNFLITGGLSAALVPRLTQLDDAAAGALWWGVSKMVVLAFAVIGSVFYLAPSLFLALLAPGRVEHFEAIEGMVALCVALALPLAALSGLAGAYLNARGRYLTSGLGTLFFNTGLILTLFLVPWNAKLALLGFGVLIGSVLRFAPQLLAFPKGIPSQRDAKFPRDPRFLKEFSSGILAIGVMLLAPVFLRASASFLDAGAISAFNYAQKLVELPVGIIASAISTVALTNISAAFGQDGLDSAKREAVRGFRKIAVLSILAASICVCFSRELVSLLFGYGRMSLDNQMQVAELLKIAALSIPFSAATSMGYSFLNATGHAPLALKTTLRVSLILPLLMLFAIWSGSWLQLMASFVIFQFALCVAIFAKCGIKVLDPGPGSVLSVFNLNILLYSLSICAISIFYLVI